MSTTTRREVLGAAAAAGALAGPLAALGGRAALADPLGLPVGVQLWAVKEDLDRDFEGALRQVAAIGYRRVEAAGWHGRTAAQFRKGVEAAGLKCDSAHLTLTELASDTARHIAFAQELGLTWLVASSPTASGKVAAAHPGEDWMDQMRRAMTLADWRRDSETMNKVGGACAKAGLKFAYHSHAFEFDRYDGVVAFDEMQRLTDPALVKSELDVGWAVAGRRDPVGLIERYPDRIRLLHIKDLKLRPAASGQVDYTTVPVGRGVIDWAPIFVAGGKAGVTGYYVEQEAPFLHPPLQELAESYRYLHALKV